MSDDMNSGVSHFALMIHLNAFWFSVVAVLKREVIEIRSECEFCRPKSFHYVNAASALAAPPFPSQLFTSLSLSFL